MTVAEKPKRLVPAESFGLVLVGRSRGAELRDQIERLASSHVVVVDLEGIEMMSPSFADELLAKLPQELITDGRVRFENVSEPISRLGQFVRTSRDELDAP